MGEQVQTARVCVVCVQTLGAGRLQLDLQQCDMLAVNPGGNSNSDDQKPQGHCWVVVEMVIPCGYKGDRGERPVGDDRKHPKTKGCSRPPHLLVKLEG